MKIELTREKLKVNKWECNSVTVYKLEDGTFEAHMHNIKGITKIEPKLDHLGRRQTGWDGKLLTNITKISKKIKSKTFEYSGIELKENTRRIEDQKYFFATNGEKSNYINYYEPLDNDAICEVEE